MLSPSTYRITYHPSTKRVDIRSKAVDMRNLYWDQAWRELSKFGFSSATISEMLNNAKTKETEK
jgi:hypothetical protein